ncbi:chemotaxis protein [Clostridiales bacterium COT073_COT-073]|nr:chemotaxis protein [Clostridiales bacterium COT073_COT-073]
MAKHKQGDGGGGAPAWMTTYGDMVTLLLCFFVLLFSMSSINQEKFQKIMEYFTGQGEYMTDFMPGGEALVGGELIINGTVQLDNIEAVLDGGRDALNSSNADAEEEAEPEDMEMTDAERQELQKLKTAREMAETIQDEIYNDGLNAEIEVSYTANYVKLTLRGEYLFDSGRAELKPDAVEAIKVISTVLKESDYNGYDIQVEGHTDNRPINTGFYKSNRYLSAARAIAVEEELVNIHGFIPQKVSSTGYGEFHPIDTNSTPEGQAHNRRVEIKLLLSAEEKFLEERDIRSQGQIGKTAENK